ncbi:DEAD-like helicase superfamily protein [Edwardsiella phage ETP-1]|uniref:DEAD-like helicase superfamily protein n=3 Tax=Kafunavirus KF1 TaxID=1982588 RepID=A0A6G5P4B6_9CAUD|nr:hypothetical protein D877_gp30 [Edwardsiella phage KF-1]QBP07028.1 DEAD-like helicase superfamily protein [Edwardsiella phage ETP-1]UIS54084.1 putative DEAD-like helicase superfamily protein [Edwardsiella phage vB_EpP_ZHX]BAM63078.1 hypothetical protein [Edwardsiella phage KF-1]BAM63127.1 hypothetical protein [Edwardsiella phage IW-1]
MTPYTHQLELSDVALAILRENGLAYLANEERTGKTLTAILVSEKSSAERILVVTKKKALTGWEETLAAFKHAKQYVVTNYHQAHKQGSNFDLVILDEAHNYISSFPKPGKIHKELMPICKGKPILYISATPYAQGPQMLFNQFKLSSYSPWYKHSNFYSWFRVYGKPYTKEINGINIPQYDRCNTEMVLDCVKHLFITKTRADLGFEHEPEDKLHFIELATNTKAVYNALLKDKLVQLSVGKVVCDSAAKLRTTLHQLEGGTVKIDNKSHVLANNEKIDYIKEHFGDTGKLAIMYNFIGEGVKLNQAFKHAAILQATSFAEGVDLHKYDELVIYSQDYSTARHTQRRARQCNQKRDKPIVVHFLLVANAISSQVYKTVSVNKRNYVDSVFERTML